MFGGRHFPATQGLRGTHTPHLWEPVHTPHGMTQSKFCIIKLGAKKDFTGFISFPALWAASHVSISVIGILTRDLFAVS